MANDIQKFFLELDHFVDKVEKAPGAVAKRVSFEVFRRITLKTPIDTGRARASWTINVNEADRRVQPEGQSSYQVPRPGLLNVQPGDTVVISNNLPYIVELENGHSKQAPVGMVAVSIEEVNVMMGKLVSEGLKDAGL